MWGTVNGGIMAGGRGKNPQPKAGDVHTCTEEVLVVLGDWY